MISCWDSFTGHNWQRYSEVSAVLAAIACLFFAILTWLLGGYNIGIGVFTFFVGLIMIPLETNWLDCIKTRKAPISPIEKGHKACSICLISDIAMQFDRKLDWNPDTEMFVAIPSSASTFVRLEPSP